MAMFPSTYFYVNFGILFKNAGWKCINYANEHKNTLADFLSQKAACINNDVNTFITEDVIG